MKVKKRDFGVFSSGKKVSLFTVSNGQMSFSVTNFGCTITSICLPDAQASSNDVVLGYSLLEGYLRNSPYFGSLVGRFANRISAASFNLNGKTYALEANDSGNCLHSGRNGFQNKIWMAESFIDSKEAGVVFRLLSKDGEQGFPGNLDLKIRYSLTADNDIILRYEAKTDAPTPVNLTNHTYFNLSGHNAGSIDDHLIQIFADRYVPVDALAIPSGEIVDVNNTPFDFRHPKKIGQDIGQLPNGYDHTWEINRAGESINPVAEVYETKSKRSLKVYSTQPGVQFYTGNFLHNEFGKEAYFYQKRGGFCLETQHFPDSPNRPEFPISIVFPEQKYKQKTIWHFDF